jgi:hypothetical protein
MRRRSLWTYLPPGPLLSLLLVGLVLFFGLLYYRATRIQRFLEPALALSKPRSDFSDAILRIAEKEFGKGLVPGIDVRMGSLVIDQALVVSASGSLHPTGRVITQRFARIFKILLEDARTRADINLLLISAGYPPGPPAAEAAGRIKAQRILGEVLDGLFAAEPVLRENYQPFFATTPRPLPQRDGLRERIEIRIIPSEMLHMEFLQRLQKYAL